MLFIIKRIAELEGAKAEAGQRPMTDAERAVRVTAIFKNPELPAHGKLVQFFERTSEGFRALRSPRPSCSMGNSIPSSRT